MAGNLRKRKGKDMLLDKGDEASESKKSERTLFSDDDDDGATRDTFSNTSAADGTSIATTSRERTKGGSRGPPVVSFYDNVESHSIDEAEDIGKDFDLFNNTIHISDVDKIDHAGLIKNLHERFKKKAQKWEGGALFYTRWSFTINFFILVMQMCQMVINQFADIFEVTTKHTKIEQSVLPRLGLYRRKMAQEPLYNSRYSVQALQCILAALTALVAGLQMKLKLAEKAERYRRGAKAYGRLLRISTYYLMLLENGGKLDDATDLWREAMRKEGKWIPMVKTFMTL